jgi:hypothetical protein
MIYRLLIFCTDSGLWFILASVQNKAWRHSWGVVEPKEGRKYVRLKVLKINVNRWVVVEIKALVFQHKGSTEHTSGMGGALARQ